jgi:hypothetical protein
MVLGAVLLAIAGTLLLRLTRERTVRTRSRAAYFDRCVPLLGNSRRQTMPHGFPRVAGDYRGQRFDLQAVPDTLTFRKLPALWLLVTLPSPMPVRATVDILRNAVGGEVFSKFSSLPVQIRPPKHYPEDLSVRTDAPESMTDDSLVSRYLDLFDTPQVKELVIAPQGLRIVRLAEEANRNRYLIFRDAEMGREPLDPAQLIPLLDSLVDLAAELEAATEAEAMQEKEPKRVQAR